MPQNLKEKIEDILLRNDDITIGGNEPKLCISLIADQILSLIIERLPEEERMNINKGGGQYGHPETDYNTGYNAYREEVIKMLKGV